MENKRVENANVSELLEKIKDNGESRQNTNSDNTDNTDSTGSTTVGSSHGTSASTAPDQSHHVMYTRTVHDEVSVEGGSFYAHFVDCKMNDCMFANCTFENVTFRNCILNGLTFHNVMLRNMDFEECRFKNVMWADVEKQSEYICGQDFDQNVFGNPGKEGGACDNLSIGNLHLGSALGLPNEEVEGDRRAWEDYQGRLRWQDPWFGWTLYLPHLMVNNGQENPYQAELLRLRQEIRDDLDKTMLDDRPRSSFDVSAAGNVLRPPLNSSALLDALHPPFDRKAYGRSRFTPEQLDAIRELEAKAAMGKSEDWCKEEGDREASEGVEYRAKGKGKAKAGAEEEDILEESKAPEGRGHRDGEEEEEV